MCGIQLPSVWTVYLYTLSCNEQAACGLYLYYLQAGSSEWFGGAVSTLNCCQDVFKENVFMVEISLYLM